ncbi:MAG: hypothetical protein V4490_01460 [Pseudomonadota bacterium]
MERTKDGAPDYAPITDEARTEIEAHFDKLAEARWKRKNPNITPQDAISYDDQLIVARRNIWQANLEYGPEIIPEYAKSLRREVIREAIREANGLPPKAAPGASTQQLEPRETRQYAPITDEARTEIGTHFDKLHEAIWKRKNPRITSDAATSYASQAEKTLEAIGTLKYQYGPEIIPAYAAELYREATSLELRSPERQLSDAAERLNSWRYSARQLMLAITSNKPLPPNARDILNEYEDALHQVDALISQYGVNILDQCDRDTLLSNYGLPEGEGKAEHRELGKAESYALLDELKRALSANDASLGAQQPATLKVPSIAAGAQADTSTEPASLWARFKAWCSRTIKAIGNAFSNLWRKITGQTKLSTESQNEDPIAPTPPVCAADMTSLGTKVHSVPNTAPAPQSPADDLLEQPKKSDSNEADIRRLRGRMLDH